jgi:hypothetical protein
MLTKPVMVGLGKEPMSPLTVVGPVVVMPVPARMANEAAEPRSTVAAPARWKGRKRAAEALMAGMRWRREVRRGGFME